jgi:predicted homoserine dehydrogenase-like protein
VITATRSVTRRSLDIVRVLRTSLSEELRDRNRPVRAGIVGAGKFASMFARQARRVPGLEIAWVADLDLERARAAAGDSPAAADARELIASKRADVVVEATGSPAAAVGHVLAAIEHGQHVVMVTVEADVVAGPVLARRAAEAGLVYTLAWGDQPALICDLVDWARLSGFTVACAGKGTRHEDGFELATPDTVWDYWGSRPEGGDPQMYCSFADGTKSAIELAAVCNATGLEPQAEGLTFPECDEDGLPDLPGRLSRSGTVEAVSGDALRWAVYVVFEIPDETTLLTLREYGAPISAGGSHAALWRPLHLVGLELAVSVVRAALCGEATGAPDRLRASVAATAKRDLRAGETLDGEGGFCAHGVLVPSSDARGHLPIGLSRGAVLRRSVPAGARLALDDVELAADAREVLPLFRDS